MVDLSAYEWTFLFRFVLAFALGTLIGLERESSRQSDRYRAGVRTYTLISLYGFGCAILSYYSLAFAFVAGLISITVLVAITYLAKIQEDHFGWTSQVMSLFTFAIGAMCVLENISIPITIGIMSTLLLSEKARIEEQVENLEKSEFLAALRFLVITLIIFPVLPNRNFTQFNLNPASIWMIVIMVSSVSFGGYFLMKRFGNSVGLWLSGIMGGIVSSTAVSVAAGRIAQQSPGQSKNALRATLLASSVMYLRILVLVVFINPNFVPFLWLKMLALSVVGAGLALSTVQEERPTAKSAVKSLKNPFEIHPALIFAALFVGISIIIELAKQFLGDAGLFLLSVVVGVVDVDPFILSLIHHAAVVQNAVVSAILLTLMSNTLMKGIYFGVLAKKVRKETILKYAFWALLHLPFVFF